MHMTSAAMWQENSPAGAAKAAAAASAAAKSWQRAEAYRLAGIALIWAAELGAALRKEGVCRRARMKMAGISENGEEKVSMKM
jgi:hypothetical protein